MITGVFSRDQTPSQIVGDELFRRFNGCADNHLHALFGKQTVRALAHASGDDHVDTSLCQPRRQQARLMRWRLDVIASDDLFSRIVHVDEGEVLAMPEVHGKFSVRHWNCNFHRFISPIFSEIANLFLG